MTAGRTSSLRSVGTRTNALSGLDPRMEENMTRSRTLTAITGSLMLTVLGVTAGDVAAQTTKSLAGNWSGCSASAPNN
jgi:hypothetical protein